MLIDDGNDSDEERRSSRRFTRESSSSRRRRWRRRGGRRKEEGQAGSLSLDREHLDVNEPVGALRPDLDALHLGELVGRRARVGVVHAGRRLLARRRRPRDNEDSTRQEGRFQRGEWASYVVRWHGH